MCIRDRASRTPKKFTEIKVVDGEVKLKIVDEVDYGRNLIAELMIITNRYMAEYAASNFHPAFFVAKMQATLKHSILHL